MIDISKPYLGSEEKEAVMEVLESGMLAQGKRAAALEERFADLCGVAHGVATSSGTSALQVALLAHDIGPDDEVITSAFTFIATVNSILFSGARPIFVDIDERTFNMDPALIEAAVTPRTRAILPIHLYGYPCDMDRIVAVAEKHNLLIIEDAAQAVGACYRGRPVGSFGTACFSLYATKNVMAGEGGMITTDDEAITEKCRMIRNHGMQTRYHYNMIGYNFRISDLHAAIGLVQMDRLDSFTEARRHHAAYLNEHLRSVITPTAEEGYDHVWHQYTVRILQDRDAAAKQLQEAGIGSGIFYPIPAHQHDYIKPYIGEVTLPATEKVAQEVLSLPVHPQLSQEDLETIVREVNRL